MIVQPASRPDHPAQPVGRVSGNASRPAVAAPNSEAVRGPAVEVKDGAARTPAGQQASSEQLHVAVEDINRAMRQSNRNLEFSVDADTHKLVVKLTDTETGELIRQIPSDETLAISRSIGEFQQGILLRQQA